VQTGLITIHVAQTPVENLWGAKQGTVATTHGVKVFCERGSFNIKSSIFPTATVLC